MTETYKIAILGAATIRGKELNEALGESIFAGASSPLMDDESTAQPSLAEAVRGTMKGDLHPTR